MTPVSACALLGIEIQPKVCVVGEKGQKIVARMCFAKHVCILETFGSEMLKA